jgi:hypothetical protein
LLKRLFWCQQLIGVAAGCILILQADTHEILLAAVRAKGHFLQCVVGENRLYTTTTNRLCKRLLFGFSSGYGLQVGCGDFRKQSELLIYCYV